MNILYQKLTLSSRADRTTNALPVRSFTQLAFDETSDMVRDALQASIKSDTHLDLRVSRTSWEKRVNPMLIKVSKKLTLATGGGKQSINVFRAGFRGQKRRHLALICPGKRKLPQGLIKALGKAANAHLPMVESKRSTPAKCFDGFVKLESRNGGWYVRVTKAPDTKCIVRDTDDLVVWEQVVKLVCQAAVADTPEKRSILKLQIGLL